MLVTAVGIDTVLGELMNTGENAADDLVPLQERIERLTTTIGNIGVAVALVAFTLLAARHVTGSGTGKTPPLLDKGVPLAVTLTVTFSMRRVVKGNAMVHHLSALETMGSVTAICADKTGTLTLNQMEVTEFWVGTDLLGAAASTEIAGGILRLLRQGAGLNTTGSVYWPDNVSLPEISGSPTEKALLSWAVACLDMDAATFKNSGKVLHLEVFNSAKEHSRAKTMESSTGSLVVHYKGAVDVVLANCSMYVDIHGALHELGVEHMKKLDKVIKNMAMGGIQCMAFAYKQIDEEGAGLTLLGLVGLKDRCRPDVKLAIEACRKAGVAVKMVTTDNTLMARAVAMECGIMSSNDPDGIIITGHEFRAMSTIQQLETVDKIRIVASSRPLDKLALVKRLKQKGHVVAVTTGAGAVDAPALKEADVVLAMSIKGTDLAAKETIIILNNKFHTVVTATRSGRCVYSNFQNLIQFHLTVNVAAAVVKLVSTVTMGNTSLTTMHLLWVNLVIGTMSALALAMDKPADALMERPPIARTAPLISNAMWRNLAAQAAFQIAVLLALQYGGRAVFDTDDKANGTMIFNVFVLCQLFNEFNVRDTEKKNVLAGVLGKNKMFLAVVAATLVLQVLTVEALTRFAGTERLGLGEWGVCVAIAAVSWPVGWAVKFISVTS
jgi:Ca2+-transporting ATPase